MKISVCSAALVLALAVPAFADGEGDVKKGEKTFKKCATCHSIVADDGTVIAKGGKVGPNLYGVIGRTAGTYPDFAYGDSIVAAGVAGKVWSAEEIAKYVVNPAAWLAEATGDAGAKTKMAFKLAKGGADVAAYIESVGPATE